MKHITKVSGIKVIEARILIGGVPRDYTKSEGVHLVKNDRYINSKGCKVQLIVTEGFYELVQNRISSIATLN